MKLKKFLSVLLCSAMLITVSSNTEISSRAEEVSEAETTETETSILDAYDISDVSDEALELELEDGAETPSSKYILGESYYSDFEEYEDIYLASPESPETFTVTDSITAVYDGSTLTFNGSGAIPDYSITRVNWEDVADSPWKNIAANVNKIVVSEGITSLGKYAFLGCSNCTDVSLPLSLTSIGEGAFCDMTSLVSLVIPDGVKAIPVAMVNGCTSLSSITYGNIVSIGDYAFDGTAISSFYIPESLTEINNLAFMFNNSIQNFDVHANNSVFKAVDGVLLSKDGTKLIKYPPKKSGDTYNCSGIITIGEGAFSNTLVKTVNLSGVKTLEESAFQDSAITSITIPDSVTEVGYFTFYECNDLKEVTFGSGLSSTSYEMFEKCTALEKINFNTALKELDARTFAYCSSLTSIVLPEHIATIGNGCFGECYGLQSVVIKGLEYIPYQSFLNCRSLKSIDFGSKLKTIYRSTFLCSTWYEETGLSEVTIPASVDYVADNAFNKDVKISCLNSKLKKFGTNGYRIMDTVKITGEQNYTFAYDVLTLVNKERANAGLAALEMDNSLLDSAMTRAVECAALFSHTRPDGSSCFSINTKIYGENIAAGSSTPEAVVNGWMNSEGHKANILGDYTTIGIGCFKHNGVYYWVQNFGSDTVETAVKKQNNTASHSINLAIGEFDEAPTSGGVIFGSVDSYSYDYVVSVDNKNIKVGQTQKAEFRIINPGFSYFVPDSDCYTWQSSNNSVASVDSSGNIKGIATGTAVIKACINDGESFGEVTINVSNNSSNNSGNSGNTSNPSSASGGTLTSKGIYCAQDNPSIIAALITEKSNANDVIEYRWVACEESNPSNWFEVSPWTKDNYYLSWTPDRTGNYIIVAYARIVGNEANTQISESFGVNFKKMGIKQICQMPYWGEGGGYLIGFESYENPNQEYQYEMFVMDLSLLAAGSPTPWVHATGKIKLQAGATPQDGKTMWTIWQPQYGYYLTLFRLYDKYGNIIDEVPYGFANAY